MFKATFFNKKFSLKANLPDEELERFKKIIEFKGEEVVTLNEKVKSIENLNNQLNKILKGIIILFGYLKIEYFITIKMLEIRS